MERIKINHIFAMTANLISAISKEKGPKKKTEISGFIAAKIMGFAIATNVKPDSIEEFMPIVMKTLEEQIREETQTAIKKFAYRNTDQARS